MTTTAPDQPDFDRPNWYIGFHIDSPELDAVAATTPEGLKAVKTPDRHLTVAFLGDCGEDMAHKVWALVTAHAPAARTETLARLEPIGLASCAKAYVVSLKDPAAVTDYLRRTRLANHAQFGIEDFFDPFAHVTMARRGNSPLEVREAASRWCRESDLSNVSIRLDRLGLYTWSDTYRQEGSVADYVMVEELTLATEE